MVDIQIIDIHQLFHIHIHIDSSISILFLYYTNVIQMLYECYMLICYSHFAIIIIIIVSLRHDYDKKNIRG